MWAFEALLWFEGVDIVIGSVMVVLIFCMKGKDAPVSETDESKSTAPPVATPD
jgi:hypothetical protein